MKYRRCQETGKRERNIQKRELPERSITKKLFGQLDKRYNKEYWRRLERQWKREQARERRTIETIKEEEKEINQEESEIRKQTEEDDKMGNMGDPYKRNPQGQGILREGQYYDLAKKLSQYLYLYYFILIFLLFFFFFFSFLFFQSYQDMWDTSQGQGQYCV